MPVAVFLIISIMEVTSIVKLEGKNVEHKILVKQ